MIRSAYMVHSCSSGMIFLCTLRVKPCELRRTRSSSPESRFGRLGVYQIKQMLDYNKVKKTTFI